MNEPQKRRLFTLTRTNLFLLALVIGVAQFAYLQHRDRLEVEALHRSVPLRMQAKSDLVNRDEVLGKLDELGADAVWSNSENPLLARYVVVFWDNSDAKIAQHGTLAPARFQRLFLDDYDLRGRDKLHIPDNAESLGFLAASFQSRIVTVPIVRFDGISKSVEYLCQGGQRGRAPAFAVKAVDQEDLLKQIENAMIGKD